MCYMLGFWEGDPKDNVCICLLLLVDVGKNKDSVVDK